MVVVPKGGRCPPFTPQPGAEPLDLNNRLIVGTPLVGVPMISRMGSKGLPALGRGCRGTASPCGTKP
jgi:hypothetical protein